MNAVFYISGAVAVATALLAVTRRNAAHALLYLVVSLLSVALVFYVLGAPFAAALEAIIYAGAIMVLFLFVIMMVNPAGGRGGEDEPVLRDARTWIGPALLSSVLAVELAYLLFGNSAGSTGAESVPPARVGAVLLGPYVLGVELASLLLLAGLVAAYHLGRRALPEEDGGSGEGGS
jgi:NADH-quinone oxidoreductase subunit J